MVKNITRSKENYPLHLNGPERTYCYFVVQALIRPQQDVVLAHMKI